jgi:hypothetical protein
LDIKSSACRITWPFDKLFLVPEMETQATYQNPLKFADERKHKVSRFFWRIPVKGPGHRPEMFISLRLNCYGERYFGVLGFFKRVIIYFMKRIKRRFFFYFALPIITIFLGSLLAKISIEFFAFSFALAGSIPILAFLLLNAKSSH